MNKIITALNNKSINDKLNNVTEMKIVYKDICYQEGIFEILEFKKADILLLSEILPGELEFKELIIKIREKYKDLEVIVFLEKENIELVNFLKINDITNIVYNNKTTINDLIININKLNKKNEIINIRNIIESEIRNREKTNKVISIIGPSGIGKSLFTCMISKIMYKNNKKILIIDLDFLNNYICKIIKNQKINILNGEKLILNNKLDYKTIKEIINEKKKEYDLILIDTSSESFFEMTKNIIKISDESIFITGTNIIDIKKSKTLLGIYENEWKLDIKKINVIFNMYNNYSIDKQILNNLFKKYKIIGKIELNNKYNKIINSNFKNVLIDKNISKDYKKITENLYKKSII